MERGLRDDPRLQEAYQPYLMTIRNQQGFLWVDQGPCSGSNHPTQLEIRQNGCSIYRIAREKKVCQCMAEIEFTENPMIEKETNKEQFTSKVCHKTSEVTPLCCCSAPERRWRGPWWSDWSRCWSGAERDNEACCWMINESKRFLIDSKYFPRLIREIERLYLARI